MIDITFYGVRGSTPCCCPSTMGIGGNTSCVALQIDDHEPVLLDLGTGLRYFGEQLRAQETGAASPFRGTALVTHLHWDHVQGLPFFVPLLRDGAHLTVVGPGQVGSSLGEEFCSFVKPPLFPVGLEVLPGTVDFVEVDNGQLAIDGAQIMVRPIEHVGETNGYRITANSAGSVAYIPDHQQPIDNPTLVRPGALELAQGVDYLIHDAQYDNDEFAQKGEWGHSTIDYAVEVAAQAEVGTLLLFHHDPAHDDDWVSQAGNRAVDLAAGRFDVVVASEGLTLTSGGSGASESSINAGDVAGEDLRSVAGN